MAKGPKNLRGDKSASTEPEERFLRRWSHQKTVARAREQEEIEHAKHKPRENEPESPGDTPAPVVHKTDADMPPLQTLDENSDYGQFLSPEVSDKLRRLALRKLFHMPGFNIRDGLDDYDEDFTIFEPLGDIVTADMRHQKEMEEEKARRRLAEKESTQALEEQSAQQRADEAEPTDVAASANEDAAPDDKAEPTEAPEKNVPAKS